MSLIEKIREERAYKEVHGSKALAEKKRAERDEKRAERARKAQEKNEIRSRFRQQSRDIGNIFRVVFSLGLAVMLFRFFTLPDIPFSLEALLNYIKSAPVIPMFTDLNVINIGGYWGSLDGFRLFLNSLDGLFSVFANVGAMLFNVLSYCYYLVMFIYGGV